MSGFTEQKIQDKLNSITLSIIAVQNYSFFFPSFKTVLQTYEQFEKPCDCCVFSMQFMLKILVN